MKQLWYVSLFLAILLGSTVLASTQVYADTQFVGTETAIISKNDTIKSVDESFTLYGLKPYFYTGDVFDATFDATVDWGMRRGCCFYACCFRCISIY
ncbi:MAG: hypothetical protein J7J27_04810 [Euryarchaeota archaeon]|nr:hypothetical protein [Euryarchaeota archaeon]